MIVFFLIICLVIIFVLLGIRKDSDDIVSSALGIGCVLIFLLFIPRYEYSEKNTKNITPVHQSPI